MHLSISNKITVLHNKIEKHFPDGEDKQKVHELISKIHDDINYIYERLDMVLNKEENSLNTHSAYFKEIEEKIKYMKGVIV